MNPLDALAKIIVGVYQTRKAQQWATLIFQMAFSSVATFLFVAGSAMVSSGSAARGIGAGMVAAAVVLVYFFRRSPLTRGMMAVIPEAEAAEELKGDFQVVQK